MCCVSSQLVQLDHHFQFKPQPKNKWQTFCQASIFRIVILKIIQDVSQGTAYWKEGLDYYQTQTYLSSTLKRESIFFSNIFSFCRRKLFQLEFKVEFVKENIRACFSTSYDCRTSIKSEKHPLLWHLEGIRTLSDGNLQNFPCSFQKILSLVWEKYSIFRGR